MTYFGNVSRRGFFKSTAFNVLAGATLWRRTAFSQANPKMGDAENSLVSSVRLLGKQFLSNSVDVTGLDGATSVQLPTGDALWMFGDTVEGPFKSIRDLDLSQLCSNTAAIVPRQESSHGIKRVSLSRSIR